LKALGLRLDLDDRNESMGLKTRESQIQKIPFALVAGDREVEAGQFAVRKYGERESKVMTQAEIIALFTELNDLPKKALLRNES
jgi:threonyl-tRNA synthetase